MIMKNKYYINPAIRFWLLVLMMIFVNNCAISVNPQEQTESTATMPISAIATDQATTATEVTPTEVNTLSTPTMTMKASPTKIPVPSLTPIPTLSIEQEAMLESREQLVQELMQTNGNCQLPCWWGIELEQNIETVGQMFTEHDIPGWNLTNSDIFNDGLLGYINTGYYEFENFFFYIGISLKFYAIDSKVKYIDVLVERPLHQYGEEELVRDWEKYALSSMLQKYGKPSYVYLIPQSVADPGPPNFVLVLYYPDMGFKFSYQPYMGPSNETQTEFCLNLKNVRQINLSLYNPELADIKVNYLLPPELNPEAETYFEQLTWEAQTGMDLDMFYEIYKDSNSPECIQVTQ